MKSICFIGGDLRQRYMYKELEKNGYELSSYGLFEEEKDDILKSMEKADIYVLPIPVSKDGVHINTLLSNKAMSLTDFCNNVSKNTKIFGGMYTKDFYNCMEEKSIQLYDFMGDEGIATFNSIATAEGAILNAMMESPINIHHSRCLVAGYGKCGKTLANKLKGLDAFVTVTARSEDALAQADTFGIDTFSLNQLESRIAHYDFIFNTIPAKVFKAEHIKNVKKTAVVIDIASNPGGVDFLACEKYKICVRHCLSIPGKYAPLTSARILNKAMLNEINKEEL